MNALWDVPELNLLSGLQRKRKLEAQVASQNKAAIQAIMARGHEMAAAAAPTANGTTAPTAADPAPAIEEDGGSIVNRSPVTTNNHYYQQAQPVPAGPASPIPAPAPKTTMSPVWPWLLAIPLMLALGGLAWYLWPKPTTDPQTPPPDWAGNTTIILRDLP